MLLFQCCSSKYKPHLNVYQNMNHLIRTHTVWHSVLDFASDTLFLSNGSKQFSKDRVHCRKVRMKELISVT